MQTVIQLPCFCDSISHNILLEKLTYYRIRNVDNAWRRSYLSNRKQMVFER